MLPQSGGTPEERVILVVDDEAFVRDLVHHVLQAAGFVILSAADGEQALHVSRTFPRTIHLLVSDVVMPKLDGIALREQILRERPSIKVLLMSGTIEHRLEGLEFLPKPFKVEALRERVLKLLPPASTGAHV